jgi:hypothetical protein
MWCGHSRHCVVILAAAHWQVTDLRRTVASMQSRQDTELREKSQTGRSDSSRIVLVAHVGLFGKAIWESH